MPTTFSRSWWWCLCVLMSGCSMLRLAAPLTPGELDVPTLGRTSARVNSLPVDLPPPLSLAWEQDVTAGIGTGSPLLVKSILFVGNQRGELYALDVSTGKRLGWVSLGASIEGSPVIDHDLAIVPIAGSRESLIGYDLVNAKVRWRAALGDIHTSPLLMNAHVFVGNTQGTFFAVERWSGEVRWRFELPRNSALKGIRSSPAGVAHHVIFGADDGAVYDVDEETGALRWRYLAGRVIQAPPSIADSTVFVGTLEGTLCAIRLADGTLRWKAEAGSSVYAAPLLYKGLCIVGTTGGIVLAVEQQSGKQVWSSDLQSPINAGILGLDKELYVGTLRKELLALDPATGSVLWRDTVSGRIKSPLIADETHVIIATDDRLIMAFVHKER